MNRIGILYHPRRSDSSELAEKARGLLRKRRIDIWDGQAHDEESLREQAASLDLLMTFGGDGTIVRAVRAVAHAGVPILGVNLGRLGFLAEVEPGQIEESISALLDGQYIIEERMMLRAELRREGKERLVAEAINDVVVARGLGAHTVRVSIGVDGLHVMTPTADGVIVSTPTGSTAYCLAAGGPIVAPDLDALTVTPIAAHLGIAHALVIPAHHHLSLRLLEGEGAVLTVDGQLDVELQIGDEVCSTASETTAKFVRFGGDGCFYATVLKKLGWPDRDLSPESGQDVSCNTLEPL
jgi:NAD+ kinase